MHFGVIVNTIDLIVRGFREVQAFNTSLGQSLT